MRRLRWAAEMRDWARWIWRLKGVFPEALGFQEFFFSLLQFLVQGPLGTGRPAMSNSRQSRR